MISGMAARLRRFVLGGHTLALADQAVISGANFLTTVVIARWSNTSELGLYLIAFSVAMAVSAVQFSLISLPYTIQSCNPAATSSEHARNSLLLSGILAVLVVFALALAVLVLRLRGAERELALTFCALAGAMPSVLLREFGRRVAFADLKVLQILTLDLVLVAIQFVGFGWLGWIDRLSSATAWLAVGAANAVTGSGYLYLARGKFAVHREKLRATMAKSYDLGKWLLAGELVAVTQGYVVPWLLALNAGTAATGIYAACMSVAGFANPVIFGLGNILVPRAVLAFKKEGSSELQRQAVRESLVLGAATALFCAVLAFAGEDAMRLLYHGEEYSGQGHTVTVLSLGLLATAIAYPAQSALAAMERADAIFRAGLLGVVLTAVLSWWFTIEWGVAGAAWGFALGNAAGQAGRWAAFRAIASRNIREQGSHASHPPHARMSPGGNSEEICINRHNLAETRLEP